MDDDILGVLRGTVAGAVMECNDCDLLDLVYKMLISDSIQ